MDGGGGAGRVVRGRSCGASSSMASSRNSFSKSGSSSSPVISLNL